MNTKQTIANLRLMASTIEELELDNVISCETTSKNYMSCHLMSLELTGIEGIWIERYTPNHPWKKVFYHNNICFFALYSQKEYDKEKNHEKHLLGDS